MMMEYADEQLVGVMLMLSEELPKDTAWSLVPTNGTIYAIEDQVLFSDLKPHSSPDTLQDVLQPAIAGDAEEYLGEETSWVDQLQPQSQLQPKLQLPMQPSEESELEASDDEASSSVLHSKGQPLYQEMNNFLVPDGMAMRPARWPDDLYTPRWVRGHRNRREGLCTLCNPPIWLLIKQSSYWYHLNFHHGISARTGRPWAPPVEWTEDRRGAKCGQCGQWISVANEMTPWYRHAQKCHKPKG